VVVDVQREIPLDYLVTLANRYDSTTYSQDLESLRQSEVKFNWVLAAAGYDSVGNLSATINKHNAIPIIAKNRRCLTHGRHTNPQRKSLEKFIDLSLSNEHVKWSQMYSIRSSCERVFSRLKEELCLRQLKVRGMWLVSIHVCLNMIAMLCVWAAAVMLGMSEISNKLNLFRF
jgi:uncharacterized protein YlbG (UPF0298 family)